MLLAAQIAVAFLAGSRVGQPSAFVPPPAVARAPVVSAAVADAVAPEQKLYGKKETPKVAGGISIGTRRLVVITGASSGLGLSATKALSDEGYYVVAAVRDPAKMDRVAKEQGISKSSYVAMKLELASLQSVKDFVSNLRLFLPARPINHLICNAAVYLPADPKPSWTDDGYEMSLGVNVRALASIVRRRDAPCASYSRCTLIRCPQHLGHFLLVQLLLPELKRAKGARCCIVGSITGNSNTIAGSFVKPVAEVSRASHNHTARPPPPPQTAAPPGWY